MSGETMRRAISQEVDRVRECIERCMQMYMNKREIVNLLSAPDFNIQPVVTRIVWAKLEEDNPQFFRAYYVRLAVKDQILEFNRLLSMQAELMCERGSLAGNSNYVFNSNQSHTIPDLKNMFNNNVPSTEAIISPAQNFHLNIGGTSDFLEWNPLMGDEYAPMQKNAQQSLDEYTILNYGVLEHNHQQGWAHDYHPMESSSSSALSRISNGQQHPDGLLLSDGFLDQNLSVSDNEHWRDSLSSTGLKNPFLD